MKSDFCKRIFIAGVMLFFVGCTSSPSKSVLATDASQVMLRSMQTRAFDTSDQSKTMRAVIATVQDLEMVIEKADQQLGSVTATKFSSGQELKMTVTVRNGNPGQTLVRANAQYGIKPVDKPEPYQDFFSALEKSMFLAAQKVD